MVNKVISLKIFKSCFIFTYFFHVTSFFYNPGSSGEPHDGKKYAPEPYVAPRPPTPAPGDGKATPGKGKGKDKGKAATPEPAPAPVSFRVD